jgi:predicted nucleotidyltransferase
MRPSDALHRHRGAIHEAIRRHPVSNPRVIGSTLDGTDRDGSDLDLLVDPLPGATLFDLGGLQEDLRETLGVPVDVLTPDDLPRRVRDRLVAQARPV